MCVNVSLYLSFGRMEMKYSVWVHIRMFNNSKCHHLEPLNVVKSSSEYSQANLSAALLHEGSDSVPLCSFNRFIVLIAEVDIHVSI